ncbi:hypothetical protein [Alkalihalobacillus sp. BA299]|uniref:hypothetical protein n=1 Tax=Alkalihalobacillus sp. BA299 TaxID=2815938 RepID=UPI0027DAD0BC|nr:hypothetical protein [Alkalihalobacillus sp. BA299]
MMLRNIQEWLLVLLIVGVIVIFGNWIGYSVLPLESTPGMIIIVLIVLFGFILEKILPIKIPSIIYIVIVGIIASLPGLPWSEYVISSTSSINFLAFTTATLAFAGVGIGRSWADFTKLGWKMIVVGLCVLIGTFLGSALIAEVVLRFQGII